MFDEDEFRRFVNDYEIEVDIEVVNGVSYYTAWTHHLPDIVEYGDNLYDVVELMWSSIVTTEEYMGDSLIETPRGSIDNSCGH
jgi:hypothetical protein